jgi:phosphoglycerate dehydrogenase-like enzyme
MTSKEFGGLHIAVAQNECDAVARRLTEVIGAATPISCGNLIQPSADCLILAAHEYAHADQFSILTARDWKFVQLTSAGYDFFARPPSLKAVVARSWQTYAAPLSEYAMRALLRHAQRMNGTGLKGTSVGIVGAGSVGIRILQALQAFDVTVRIMRKRHIPVAPGVETSTALSDLIDSDQLVLAVPLNNDTRGLVSQEYLSRCKESQHIVNISRGELIDQRALLEAVQSRHIFATLDVTVPEPLPRDHPLRRHPGVTITDHIAWRSGPDDLRYLEDFFTNWELLQLGRPPLGVIPVSRFEKMV